MKKIIYSSIIGLLFILLLSLAAKPIIILLAKRQLANVFIDSEIDIGSCNFNPFNRLALLNIEIKNKHIYDFKIRELELSYALPSLARKNLSRFSLRDAVISLRDPQKSIQEIYNYFRITSQSAFLINSLECTGIKLNFESRESRLNALLSAQLDLAHNQLNRLTLNVDTLSFGDFALEKGFLEVVRTREGRFGAAKIKYGKLRIENIQSTAGLENNAFFLDSLSAGLLGGSMRGSASLKTVPAIDYRADLTFHDIDLEAFVKDFDLGEKLELSGRMNGSVNMIGNILKIRILNGDFSTLAPGGTLAIKDRDYLKELARNSNQSLDLLLESFHNYRYNNGMLNLSLDKGNLVMDAALDGENGKRNLTVVVHDFKLIKEGK